MEKRKKRRICFIVLAAGKGKRMQKRINKMYLEVKGIPILYRTIKKINDMKAVDEILVVIGKKDIPNFDKMVSRFNKPNKIKQVIIGGKERADSVRKALKIVNEQKDEKVILVHDGARPFISERLVERVIKKIEKCRIVVPYQPIRDTVRRIENDKKTVVVDRDKLVSVQTPQAFLSTDIEACYFNRLTNNKDFTDDAAYFEALNYEVCLEEGERWNIKITDKEDLKSAESMLQYYVDLKLNEIE